MTRFDTPLRAMLLTAVAVHGLLAAPLAHAEEHAREAEEDASATEAVKWAAEKSGDPVDALAYALEHAHALGHDAPARQRHAPASRHAPAGQPAPGHHAPASHHHHDHGAPAGDQHGQGTLSHFAFALHSVPPPPPRLAPPPPPSLRASLHEQRHTLVRYLVPERSQAPPLLASQQPDRSMAFLASFRRPSCLLQPRLAAACLSSPPS